MRTGKAACSENRSGDERSGGLRGAAGASGYAATTCSRARSKQNDRMETTGNPARETALDRFRAAVLADPSLQERLRAPRQIGEFIPLAVETAQQQDIVLSADDVQTGMRLVH